MVRILDCISDCKLKESGTNINSTEQLSLGDYCSLLYVSKIIGKSLQGCSETHITYINEDEKNGQAQHAKTCSPFEFLVRSINFCQNLIQ